MAKRETSLGHSSPPPSPLREIAGRSALFFPQFHQLPLTCERHGPRRGNFHCIFRGLNALSLPAVAKLLQRHSPRKRDRQKAPGGERRERKEKRKRKERRVRARRINFLAFSLAFMRFSPGSINYTAPYSIFRRYVARLCLFNIGGRSCFYRIFK